MKKINQYLNQPSKKTKELEGEELRESEEKYRRLFNGITDAVFVHPVTAEGKPPGKFIEVNDAACQKLGYTREELLKLSHFDITAPEELGNIPAIREKLLARKHHLFEIVAVTKDGEKIPLEINIQQFDLNGQPVVLSIARDITERKKVEAELRKSKEHLELIFRTMPCGIFMVDLEKRITSWSIGAEQLTGLKAEAVIGKKCTEIWGCPPCLERCGLYAEDVKKPIYGKECPIIIEGRTFVASKNVDFLRDEEGDISGGLETFEDITERKQAEEALKKKNEELERFNKLAVDRELKMIELKKEINALLDELGKEPRYKIVDEL